MIYNNEAEIKDLIVTVGDTVDISLSVYKNLVLYDMTGMQLDIDIVGPTGVVLRSLSSAGGSPAITIATSSFNISTTAFASIGKYSYDVQLTNGTAVSTIIRGNWIVQKHITGSIPAPAIPVSAASYRIVNVGGSLVVQYSTDGITWATVITLFTP
jgi:hypothetical protein